MSDIKEWARMIEAMTLEQQSARLRALRVLSDWKEYDALLGVGAHFIIPVLESVIMAAWVEMMNRRIADNDGDIIDEENPTQIELHVYPMDREKYAILPELDEDHNGSDVVFYNFNGTRADGCWKFDRFPGMDFVL